MSVRKLHPRDVMLIRRLEVFGWSDYQILKKYRIPIPVIQKANKEIERQATEEFDNNVDPAFGKPHKNKMISLLTPSYSHSPYWNRVCCSNGKGIGYLVR
jgi:hypothetical protein